MLTLKSTIYTLTVGAFLLGAPAVSFAQDKAAKQENADYIRAVAVNYKPGKRRAAFEMIETKFKPAGMKAGVPGPWTLHVDSGMWDAVYFWNLEGGYADLEYSDSPNGVKWWAAFVELEGSEEAAAEVWATYQSYVASTSVLIGHHHRAEKEKE